MVGNGMQVLDSIFGWGDSSLINSDEEQRVIPVSNHTNLPKTPKQDMSNFSQFKVLVTIFLAYQRVTKICRLPWLTDSALEYESKCGGGGDCGVSANEYSCTQEVKQTLGI